MSPKRGPKRRPKVGVPVIVRKSAGRKPVKGAFVMEANGGRVLVKREGKDRLPVVKLHTAAPIRHLEKDDVREVVSRTIEDRFYREFEMYADHLLDKAGL